jgi:hypothetical protein
MPKHYREPESDQEHKEAKLIAWNKAVGDSDFCFISCEPEVGMDRLAVECSDYKHALKAYFETDEEALKDIQACQKRGKNPWDISSSDEDEKEVESDNEETRQKKLFQKWDLQAEKDKLPELESNIIIWQNSLTPRSGHWMIHMPTLGISKLFQERNAAQLYIFRRMQEKIPGLKISSKSIRGYAQEMGVMITKHRNGMESYLKIADVSSHILDDDMPYGICIAFQRLNPIDHKWYFELPLGCGPLEHPYVTNIDSELYEMDKKHWRFVFQEKFNLLEKLMIEADNHKDFQDDFRLFAKTYTEFLLMECSNDSMFREMLCGTNPKQNLYYIDSFGFNHRALFWEHVRSVLNGELCCIDPNLLHLTTNTPKKFIDLRTGNIQGLTDTDNHAFSTKECSKLLERLDLTTPRHGYENKIELCWEHYFEKKIKTEYGSEKLGYLNFCDTMKENWFKEWFMDDDFWRSPLGYGIRDKLKTRNISVIISSAQGASENRVWN